MHIFACVKNLLILNTMINIMMYILKQITLNEIRKQITFDDLQIKRKNSIKLKSSFESRNQHSSKIFFLPSSFNTENPLWILLILILIDERSVRKSKARKKIKVGKNSSFVPPRRLVRSIRGEVF